MNSAPVIDEGAGWSTLVDHLHDRGCTDVTAVDLSLSALNTVRDRIGADASGVQLIVSDVLDLDLGRQFALWHDRATVRSFIQRAFQLPHIRTNASPRSRDCRAVYSITENHAPCRASTGSGTQKMRVPPHEVASPTESSRLR